VSGAVAAELPFAHGGPALTGRLRAAPEDFEVEEIPGFEPSGSGEHALLWVEKRGANTVFVARELARLAAVSEQAVGFAGMKDRHALTRQRFSVHLPGRPDPDWSSLSHPEFRVLSATRHARKLPRGALAGNRFRLTLREIDGDRAAAEHVLAAIAAHGVPNYFGEQRFGSGGRNVERARAMFAGARVARSERGMLLSAARSELFNAILAQRVGAGSWDLLIPGDVLQLDGRGSIFGPEPLTPELHERAARGEIHPTGPLWGRGPLRTDEQAARIERDAGGQEPGLCAGLEAAGLKQERRPLRMLPREFSSRWIEAGVLELGFELTAGCYATTVLRELGRFG
jgi:tRNA pseudouridine13 synthase